MQNRVKIYFILILFSPSIVFGSAVTSPTPETTRIKTDSVCSDIFVFTNGEQIQVHVLAIRESTIKYNKCDERLNHTFSIRKKKLSKIIYADGSEETIDAEEQGIKDRQSIGRFVLIGLAVSAGVALLSFLIVLGLISSNPPFQ